ncbi:MAG: hypothetical protein ACHQHP_02055 [Bacteroidia bacterium]
MKTSKITLSIAAVMLAMAVSVISCKKKESADSDTSGASDNSLAEKTADDVTNMGGQASEDGSMSSYRYAGGEDVLGLSCATVSVDTNIKKITVTFSGQPCLDGHTRSGTLTYDYSGSAPGAKYYRNPGFKFVVSSSNYVVDGNAVSINKTVTNTTASGFDPKTTNLTWSIADNVSIKKSNGTVTWSANKVKTLLNTSDTNVYRGQAVHIMWSLARVGITGNATGTTVAGENFSANVTTQLVRDFTCAPNSLHPGHHPFIQGALTFTPGSKAPRYFDFGNGACDDIATVTINGNTYTITLP